MTAYVYYEGVDEKQRIECNDFHTEGHDGFLTCVRDNGNRHIPIDRVIEVVA